jgi:protein arginine phosphatase
MNIYFICTGNTCRSPMAEAILKSMNIDQLEVRSAGIYALDGGEMSGNAKAVLASQNIAMNHASKLVNETDLKWANLILTMTTAHKQIVVEHYPQFADKIFTLKEYTAPYASRDVSDPFGGDYSQYEQTFLELKQHMELLKEKLEEGEL